MTYVFEIIATPMLHWKLNPQTSRFNTLNQHQNTLTVKPTETSATHNWLPCMELGCARYSLWEEDREGLEGEWGGGGEVVGAGGGVGLVLGTGAASTSDAAAAGTLRTLLTRSVSRDTEWESRSNGRMDEGRWLSKSKEQIRKSGGNKKRKIMRKCRSCAPFAFH